MTPSVTLPMSSKPIHPAPTIGSPRRLSTPRVRTWSWRQDPTDDSTPSDGTRLTRKSTVPSQICPRRRPRSALLSPSPVPISHPARLYVFSSTIKERPSEVGLLTTRERSLHPFRSLYPLRASVHTSSGLSTPAAVIQSAWFS